MSSTTETKTVSFVEFLTVIFNNRKKIIRNFLVFTIVGLVISLILPHWYTSTAILLPPEKQQGLGVNLLSMVADLPFDVSGMLGVGGTMTHIHIGILNSRNVRVNVIEKLDLMNIWEEEYLEYALRRLDGQTKIDVTEEGLITISCTARTRERAKQMAETFVQELDRVNRDVRYSSAKYTREFIEKRLTEADQDLRQAVEAMRDFQKKHGVISIEEQTLASIRAAAEIQGEIALTEVEHDVLLNQLSRSHEKVKLIKNRLNALQTQLDRIESGNGATDELTFIPFDKIPDLGLQYVFLFKDVEVQKEIYKMLAAQFEQARIQETRDTPTVELLDAPALPERKSKPKRAYVVLAASFLSFFVSGFSIVLSGYFERVQKQNPEVYGRFMSAYQSLRLDFRRFIPFVKK